MIRPASRSSRSRIALIGAGLLVLMGVASFIILDLREDSVTSAGLPVIQIGSVTEETDTGTTSSTAATSAGDGQGQPGPSTTTSDSSVTSSTQSSSLPESTASGGSGQGPTTGSTLRHTEPGGVRIEEGQGAGRGLGGGSSSGTTGGNR